MFLLLLIVNNIIVYNNSRSIVPLCSSNINYLHSDVINPRPETNPYIIVNGCSIPFTEFPSKTNRRLNQKYGMTSSTQKNIIMYVIIGDFYLFIFLRQ